MGSFCSKSAENEGDQNSTSRIVEYLRDELYSKRYRPLLKLEENQCDLFIRAATYANAAYATADKIWNTTKTVKIMIPFFLFTSDTVLVNIGFNDRG